MTVLSVPYVMFTDWHFDVIHDKGTESKKIQQTQLSWRLYCV